MEEQSTVTSSSTPDVSAQSDDPVIIDIKPVAEKAVKRKKHTKVEESGQHKKAKKEETAKSELECPICYVSYKKIRKRNCYLLATRCGHVFCNRCLDTQPSLKSKCAVCRQLNSGVLRRIYIR